MSPSSGQKKHVYILGVPRKQADSIPASYADKVLVVTDEQLHSHSAGLKPLNLGDPLYISIDKFAANAR